MTLARQIGITRNALASVLIFLVVSLCVSSYLVSKTLTDSRNNDTLCSAENPPMENWVVLLDATDQPSPLQLNVVTLEVLEMAEQMPVNQRFSVVVIHPDTDGINPVRVLYSRCKPPDGEGMNDLYQAQKLASKRYDSHFLAPLQMTIKASSHLSPTKTSPILEAVYLVSKELGRDLSVTRMLVVSDLMQNSDLLDFYRDRIDYGELHKAKSYVTDNQLLSGVDIRVLHLARKGNRQNESYKFWGQYFKEAGAVYKTPRTI